MQTLSQRTKQALHNCESIHKHRGFQSDTEVVAFWRQFGPTGFLNIKEIDARMVAEIRALIASYRPDSITRKERE